jgi:hypothetical protein
MEEDIFTPELIEEFNKAGFGVVKGEEKVRAKIEEMSKRSHLAAPMVGKYPRLMGNV